MPFTRPAASAGRASPSTTVRPAGAPSATSGTPQSSSRRPSGPPRSPTKATRSTVAAAAARGGGGTSRWSHRHGSPATAARSASNIPGGLNDGSDGSHPGLTVATYGGRCSSWRPGLPSRNGAVNHTPSSGVGGRAASASPNVGGGNAGGSPRPATNPAGTGTGGNCHAPFRHKSSRAGRSAGWVHRWPGANSPGLSTRADATSGGERRTKSATRAGRPTR